MDLLQMDCLQEPFFDHDDRHRHLAVRILMTTWLDNDDYVNHVTSLTKETFPPFTV